MALNTVNLINYVVSDRSFGQNVSTANSYSNAQSFQNGATGVPSNMVDGDLSTSYAYTTRSNNENYSEILIDYGQVFFNVQLSYEATLFAEAGVVSTAAIEISTDGASWTALHSVGAGTNSYNEAYNGLALRYVRFWAKQTGQIVPLTASVTVYECRLMGSLR